MRARIALDAMGGDAGPAVVVRVACAFSLESDIETILVGDEAHLQSLIDQQPYDPARVTVRHASSWIAPDEDGVLAMRRKKKNSLALAASMVGEGEADALVAGGNREAFVSAVVKYFQSLPDVTPGFGFAFAPPNGQRSDAPLALVLDAGVTEDCCPDELSGFAIMGSLYFCRMVSRRNARVGLLVDADGSGSASEGEALAASLDGVETSEFVGEVRIEDLNSGLADVLVCAGRLGRMAMERLEVQSSGQGRPRPRSRWPRSWRRASAAHQDPTAGPVHVGSPVLGLSRTCLHAGRNAVETDFHAAVVMAARLVRADFDGEARRALAAVS